MTRNEMIADFNTRVKPIVKLNCTETCLQTVLGEVFDGLVREYYINGKVYVKGWINPYTNRVTDLEA